MVFVDFRSVLKVSGKGVSLPFERPSRVTLFFKWNNSSLSPTQQTVRQTETDCASPHFFCLVLVFSYFAVRFLLYIYILISLIFLTFTSADVQRLLSSLSISKYIYYVNF